MARRTAGTHVKKMDNLRWDTAFLNNNAQAAGSVGQTAQLAVALPETLLRIRGTFLAYLDGTQTGGEAVRVSTGLIVMPEGLGVSVISNPIADGNAPWLWFETFVLAYEEMVSNVVDIPGATSFRVAIDSKAMRKLRPDREIQWVTEVTTVLTTSAVNSSLQARFLYGS